VQRALLRERGEKEEREARRRQREEHQVRTSFTAAWHKTPVRLLAVLSVRINANSARKFRGYKICVLL
jgi:hypothetical protein